MVDQEEGVTVEETVVDETVVEDIADESSVTEDTLSEEEQAPAEECVDETVQADVTEATVSSEQIESTDEPAGTVSDISCVLDSLSGISARLDQMNQLFVQRIQHTDAESKVIDQMHSELTKYKDDMYAQLVRPILLDIIEIRESIRRVSESFEAKPEEERNVPLKTFSDYTYDLQDILEKNNIIIFNSKDGDDFNPLKQRAVKKVVTSDESLNGKIAVSRSSGYEYMGKTISHEKVEVYIYQQSETEEGEN